MRAWILICLLALAANADDVLVRAQRAAYIPTLQFRYSNNDNRHVFWATLAWDFDEFVSPAPALLALEITRLRREKDLLIRDYHDLASDALPAID